MLMMNGKTILNNKRQMSMVTSAFYYSINNFCDTFNGSIFENERIAQGIDKNVIIDSNTIKAKKLSEKVWISQNTIVATMIPNNKCVGKIS